MANFQRKLIYVESIVDKREVITLRVWQNKCSMYAKLLFNNNCVFSASFYEKDGDMSIKRIKEYFNL